MGTHAAMLVSILMSLCAVGDEAKSPLPNGVDPPRVALPVASPNVLPTDALPAKPVGPPEFIPTADAKAETPDDPAQTVQDKFDKLAAEIDVELEKRSQGANRSVQVIGELQEVQRDAFRDAQKRWQTSLRERPSRENRLTSRSARQQMIIAGARLNELQRRANAASSPPTAMRQNRDLMSRLSEWIRSLTAEERAAFGRDQAIQRRHQELMQKLITGAFPRNATGPQLLRDLTVELVIDDRSLHDRPIPAYDHAQPGPIQNVRVQLGRILTLAWQGERLTLNTKAWDDVTGGMSAADLAKDVDGLLQTRGVETNDGDLIRRQHPMMQSQVYALFEYLQAEFGDQQKRLSADNNVVTFQFSAKEADAEFRSTATDYHFEFRERIAPRRTVQLEYQTDGTLQINLYGEEIFRLKQAATGAVSIVEVIGTELVHREAASFAALYRSDPEFVEKRLFPLLDHVGFTLPPSRFDREIVYEVVRTLAPNSAKQQQERVRQAIVELDDAQYETRQAALRYLEANLDIAREELAAALAATDISFEQQQQVERLLAMANNDVEDDGELIAAWGLLDDTEYLGQLLPTLSAEDAIGVEARMQQLSTGATRTDDQP